MRLALTLARRELRGGLKGFRILVACLALGVTAIAGAASLKASFDLALARDARALLGGDLDIRLSHRQASDEQIAYLAGLGRLSSGLDMRAMAQADSAGPRRLVELKGVDDRYPLVGSLELDPPMSAAQALGERDGLWGAVADPHLLDALDIDLGQVVNVGDARFQIRALIVKEPDRVATVLSFGPRLMIDVGRVAATGLVLPGSLIRYSYALDLGADGDAQVAKRAIEARFPEAGWQVRDIAEAAPGVGRFLDNMAVFLTLVGLTALLVGGIGIANAVKAYLDGRIATIAALKCLGAPAGLILRIYLLLVGLLSTVGILIGLAAGALVPALVMNLAGDQMPLAAEGGIHLGALGVASAFGGLTALVFTLWPLARARAIPATALFRRLPTQGRFRPTGAVLAALILSGGGLAVLAVAGAARKDIALVFVVAALVTLVLFRLVAAGLSAAAKRLARRPGAGTTLRLAMAALHRPGSAVVSVVLSLGLGLTVMVIIALVEGNLARQFGEKLPKQAPSFFFIDLQSGQTERFDAIIREIAPAALIERAPMVRGRVTRIKGRPAAEVPVDAAVQWAVRGDRGLTSAIRPPAGNTIIAGDWWPEDYAGPPLVSVSADIAKGFHLKLGDEIGLNVLGRDIAARVASTREVEWGSLNMNFAFILTPGALAGAPHSWVATVHAPADLEGRIERAVTDQLANVSAIRIKEALDSVRAMIANAEIAVRLAALVTLAAGALVLAGAVMAGHRRRVGEAVVLKVLGASGATLWRAWLVEFGVVGLVTGLGAGLVGSVSAWAILVHVMRADWVFLPGLAATVLAVSILASLLAGFAGTLKAMRTKAAPYLREE